MLKAYHNGDVEQFKEIRGLFKATKDKTAREVADSALLDAVYDEWSAGAIDDREALDILEATLEDPPETENDERVQVERWQTRKENESRPKGEKISYGAWNDLKDAVRSYVYPENGADRVTAGKAAEMWVEQYRAWGYDDKQIRNSIREAVKDEYVEMPEGQEKKNARDYIAKIYTFTKDGDGKAYDITDAKNLIDKWEKTPTQLAKEEAVVKVDDRPWG